MKKKYPKEFWALVALVIGTVVLGLIPMAIVIYDIVSVVSK